MSSRVAATLLKSLFLMLIVGAISLYAQHVSSPRNECIHIDNDDAIHMYLKSSKNYYSIARAIFPSPGIPSLYVKISVQFNTSSSNNSFPSEDEKKYTWSKSCLFVATQFVGLYAINVYSVSAVWPNRRDAELSVTIPKFCNATDEEIKTKMIYFLSTLEDVAINTKMQDPRLNTVQCVVEGHNYFNAEIFSGLRKLLMYACWCIWTISFVIGYVISNTVISLLYDKNKEETTGPSKKEGSSEGATGESLPLTENAVAENIPRQDNHVSEAIDRLHQLLKKDFADKTKSQRENDEEQQKYKVASIQFLAYVLAIIEHILAVVALGLVGSSEGWVWVYPSWYLASLHIGSLLYYISEATCKVKKVMLFLVLFGPIGCVLLLACKCFLPCECLDKTSLFHTITHLTFIMSVHHLLWILLGVMTEPLWAVPVLVLNGCIWFCIYLLAYYFEKSGKEFNGKDKCKAIALSVAVVICVMLALLVLGVAAQSFLGTDPLTGIVSGVLSIVASWILKKLI